MSEETKIICRMIYYQVRKAKTLEEAVEAVRILAGPNAVEVEGILAQEEEKKKNN